MAALVGTLVGGASALLPCLCWKRKRGSKRPSKQTPICKWRVACVEGVSICEQHTYNKPPETYAIPCMGLYLHSFSCHANKMTRAKKSHKHKEIPPKSPQLGSDPKNSLCGGSFPGKLSRRGPPQKELGLSNLYAGDPFNSLCGYSLCALFAP